MGGPLTNYTARFHIDKISNLCSLQTLHAAEQSYTFNVLGSAMRSQTKLKQGQKLFSLDNSHKNVGNF